ncbi:MAG: hypothetical protein GC162_10970 [Planctomycetes bacterium]|nr:hypothetical protein [Planctomycetota bacterium]
MNHALTVRLLTALVIASALAVDARAALILHYTINSSTVHTNIVDDVSATQISDGYRSGGGSFALTTDHLGQANEALVVSANSIAVDNSNGGISTGGSGTFTIAMWYKGTGTGYLFDQLSTRFVWSLNTSTSGDANDGGAASGIGVHWNGTWYNSGVTTGFNDNAWHHIALVLDNDGSNSFFSIYLDGSAIDVNPASAGVQTTRAITGIANLTTQASNFTQRLASAYNGTVVTAGSYDDIRIYNTALSATEIHNLVITIPAPAALPAGLALLLAMTLTRRRD